MYGYTQCYFTLYSSVQLYVCMVGAYRSPYRYADEHVTHMYSSSMYHVKVCVDCAFCARPLAVGQARAP